MNSRFTIYINKEEYYQVVCLEQTVLEKRVHYKGFLIPLS